MGSRLLDSNTISIISSPNKEFYRMAAVDSSDGELLCDLNGIESVNGRIDHVTSRNVRNSCDPLKIAYRDGQQEDFLSLRFTPSDSLESFASTSRNSGDSVDCSPRDASLSCSDISSESLSVGSEAVFDVDATVRSTLTSSESPSAIRSDVFRAVSLANLFSPIYMQKAQHRSEGYLNTRLEKSRRLPRRCSRKSRSVQNNCSAAAQKSRRELFAETPTFASGNSRRRISENCSSSRLKQKNVWKSLSFTEYLSDDIIHWNSRNSRIDVEDSENENGFRTSDSTKMTSTMGQESKNVDPTWDEYQVPLYEAISDDPTEEKLDASCLQGDWQPLTDEFSNLSDFGKDIHREQKPLGLDQDSDTDTEELHCFMKDSNKALHLTKASLAAVIRSRIQTGKNSSVKELLATCETNVTCLRNLLDVVDQRYWDVHDISNLSELVAEWEDVESQLHQLTSYQDLSNLKSASDVIINLSPNDDDDVTICKEIDVCSTEVNIDEAESVTSATFPTQSNGFFIPNRFTDFGSRLYNLLDESSFALKSNLTSKQHLLFVLLIMLVAYLFIYRRCFVNILDVRFEPQLRYVIGPPPI